MLTHSVVDDEELKALSIQLQSSPTFQRVSEQAEGDLPELSYMTSLVDAATRMVFSRPFSLFYMTMVFLNSVLLIWVSKKLRWRSFCVKWELSQRQS